LEKVHEAGEVLLKSGSGVDVGSVVEDADGAGVAGGDDGS